MSLRRGLSRLAVWCAFVWLAAAGTAMATDYRGQVVFNGLPLPGSLVTVTATQGDKKVTAISDDQGLFRFTDLTDGTWTLSIEMTGFATVKQDVSVAPNAPMGTFEMKLMTLEQIRAAAKPVKVEAAVASPAVAATETPAAPGAAATPGAAAPAKGGAKAASKGGAVPNAPAAGAAAAAAPAVPDATTQQASDGYLINGSVNNAATSQYSLNQAFGNTRNGRSLYNGGFSLTNVTDSVFDAKQYPITGEAVNNPSFLNFSAGFTFGGPMKIPHVLTAARAPNFFVAYQRTQSDNNTSAQAIMPTLAERAGNLSALTGDTIYAPTTGLSAACIASGVTPGSPFLGNVIPSACISSQAQALLNFYPLPTITGTVVGNNYQTVTTSDTRQDSYSLRMYKQIGSKNNINGGFGFQDTRVGNNSLFGFHDITRTIGMNSNIEWYHRFTQRLSMDANYTFSRLRTQQAPYFANFENIEGMDGITGVDAAANYWGPPSLGFSSGIAGLSDGISAYNRNETNSLAYYVDWNKFRHNVRIGGDFRRQEFNVLTEANPRGSFNFNGTATNGGVVTAGSDFADFLLGVPDTSSINYGNADKYLRQSVYDLYARDDFRVNPEFSINYGVRWEYGAPITELKGRLVNLDIAPGFTAEAPVLASNPVGSLTGLHYPTSLVNPDKIGVAPNIGIAWRPISGSSLLVRSGYQIAHDTSVYTTTAMSMATQSPLSTSLQLSNSNCALTLANGFSSCPTITPDQFAIDPNFRVGYIQIWNLAVQRDLPGSLQMIVTYLGNKGTRGVQQYLPNTYPYGGTNPCPSCPSGFAYRTSGGDSTRESGQVQLRRRLRNGFTANLSYIYSKSLDDDFSFGGGSSTAVNSQVAQNWRNLSSQRGLSTFDQRNVITVSAQYTTGMGLGGHTLMSGWKGAIYKEWTVAANFSAGSGLPLTPIYQAAVPGTGYSGIFRANYTGVTLNSPTPGVYVNPAAFAAPAAGQYGDARRDSIPGPDQFSLNAQMNRGFRLHDRYNLTAEIDANNVLNHVVFGSYYTNLTPGSTSSTTANLFGTPLSPNTMRTLSATLRLRF